MTQHAALIQTESMVEFCSKNIVRAIGKVLLMIEQQLKPIKVMKNGLCL